MNLWKSYLRWRHSKGYGVHSPYAYRFVKDVVSPGGYGYYAYHVADRLALSSKFEGWKQKTRIYFLIRLLVFLKARRVVFFGKENISVEIASRALQLSLYKTNESKKVKFLPGDMIILNARQNWKKSEKETDFGTEVIKNKIEAAIGERKAILCLNPTSDLRVTLEKPIKKGVLFTSPDLLLLIPRDEMEYVAYDMKF